MSSGSHLRIEAMCSNRTKTKVRPKAPHCADSPRARRAEVAWLLPEAATRLSSDSPALFEPYLDRRKIFCVFGRSAGRPLARVGSRARVKVSTNVGRLLSQKLTHSE